MSVSSKWVVPAGAWAIVTGAGSGIGRAVAVMLSRRGLNVVAVGRRSKPLEETAELASNGKIVVVSADVGEDAARSKIVAAVPDGGDVAVVVHNAATVQPIARLEKVSLEQWRASFAANVEGPLFLTKALLGRLRASAGSMKTKPRVLHLSSGAAHSSVPGWGTYCASKAALFSLYGTLRQELASDVVVGSLRPGVVDTQMQGEIRESKEEDFPNVERFKQMKQSGALLKPSSVANFTEFVLFGTDDEEFGAEEWDPRIQKYADKWVK